MWLELRFSNSGASPSREGRDAMLEEARMTPKNRYTYTIFIDNALIYSEWGALNIFSFYRGGLAKIN